MSVLRALRRRYASTCGKKTRHLLLLSTWPPQNLGSSPYCTDMSSNAKFDCTISYHAHVTQQIILNRIKFPTCAGPSAASRSLARLGSSNFRALTAEKRAKETRCAPVKRLEITARLPFNFVLVRLGLHPHKEVMSGNF